MNPQRRSELSSSLPGEEALNTARLNMTLTFSSPPRPVVEQEKELRTRWGKEKKELQGGQEKAGDRVGQEKRREDRTVERKEEQSKMVPPQPTREQFGEGFVQTRECSDTDRLSLLSAC